MNQENHRRSHLTKEQRLPQSYKEVEKILNIVKRCEANVKTVLNNSKLRGAVLHKVSGLTFNVLKQRRLLDSIIEKTQVLEKEPNLRKELAGILIHELIFGNGLPGKSKPVETVLRYQVEIEKAYNELKSDNSLFDNSLTYIPKYVRVNTLAIALPEVLEDLECLGVKQIVFDANISEEEFYKLIKNLEKNTFLLDYHFKDLLVFNSEENLTTWSLYQKGHVFIQDKSSYIPAYVLAPPPGATVIDACAAPGMKTLHLTALMENNGVIYACERDQQRFEILNKMLKSGHANICQTFCGDFNSVDPRDEKYSSVEYILLDPSCSGSGMVNRMDYITDTKESKNDLRIQKLAGFQIILLKHALLFPSVKRVVYSTCSITETENEFVIHEVLNHFSHRFKLSPVLPDWSIRGSNNFEFGSHCLRAYPDKCFTNGFFVAMFERLEEHREQYPFEKKQHKHEKKKLFNDSNLTSKNQIVGEERTEGTTLDPLTEAAPEIKIFHLEKKHKQQHEKDSNSRFSEAQIEISNVNNDIFTETVQNVESSNKKKKKHESKNGKEDSNSSFHKTQNLEAVIEVSNVDNDIFTETVQNVESSNKKKKKHKSKNGIEDSNSSFHVAQNLEAVTEISNIDNDIFIETVQNVESSNKKKKKHKSKKGKDDSNSSFHETQNLEAVIEISNVDNEIFAETVQNVESSNKKKKKHKSKNGKDDSNNNFHETQNLEISNVDNDIFIETVQNIESSSKMKKTHKSKHKKEDSNNSFCEIQNPEAQTEISNVDNNIFTETVQKVESSHEKKKKHKNKYEKEDFNNSFCETQNPVTLIEISDVGSDIFVETVQKVEFSHKKKKKHKRKHEIEECNNSFYQTLTPEVPKQNLNVEKDTITETVQKVETSHKKKKHKRKHEAETSNLIFER
ncbi:uncharacterized protein [Parasteatoda tepidariorum]|uniref:uncharacterized protein n=1 Tax=Parasteatoda tepidariorum TaxID=114398 RepID=UPI001C71C3A4|nr:uncharacterized protein LOC107438935 [Parasteatoda tepidariorum]